MSVRYTLYILELWTSCYELLAGFVRFVLLEVLYEATSKVFGLLFPLCCISVCIAWVEDFSRNAFQLRRNSEVEVRYLLCRSCVDRVVQDSIDDTACILDRDTLACSVPARVHQVSLGTALLHLLNQFFSILCWVTFKESLTESSRECRSRICDAAFRTCQLSCKSRKEVVLCLLRIED